MGKIDFDKFILSLRKLQKTIPTSWMFALAEQGLEIVDGQIVHKKTKFKVGDIMRDKYEAEKGIVDGLPVVVDIRDGMYVCNNECIPVAIQDEYEYPPMNRKSQRMESAKAKEAILPDKEEELTEFESKLKYYLNNEIPDMYQYSDNVIKCYAAELLSIARKQIAEDIRIHSRKMYREFNDSYYSTKNGAYLRGIKDTIKKIEGE